MLPASILDFMLPGELEEVFYAGPPIQRSVGPSYSYGMVSFKEGALCL